MVRRGGGEGVKKQFRSRSQVSVSGRVKERGKLLPEKGEGGTSD